MSTGSDEFGTPYDHTKFPVKETANSHQIGGQHYKALYQHWDLVTDTGMGYFEGQITRYLARWRKKNGREDLEKALHYYTKLLEISKDQYCYDTRLNLYEPRYCGGLCATTKNIDSIHAAFANFTTQNELGIEERVIFLGLMLYETVTELQALQPYFTKLLKENK